MAKHKSDRKNNRKKNQKQTRNKKRRHDNFFRTVFSNPKYARKLLQLAAKRNKRLRQFLSLVKISTLRQIPGDAPREGLGGCADVAFHVKLARSKAELLVGIVLEHKSFPDSNIRYQLLKYYFEVMEQKSPGVPMVAIVVYNGKEKWNALPKPYPSYPKYFQEVGLPFRVEFINIGDQISMKEFDNLSPEMKLALVAMRYVFDALGTKEKFSSIAEEFIHSPREECRKIIEEVFVYLRDSLQTEDKEVLMDTLEALRNKGFKSIADAEREEHQRELRNATRRIRREERKKAAETIASMAAENASKDAEIASMAAENTRFLAKIAELEAALAAK